MASDQQVSARIILKCQLDCQRRGRQQVLRQLEQVEPELASFLMESGSSLCHKLFQLGGPPKATQRVYDQMEQLLLVCLMALRQGHAELWQQGLPGTPLAALDPPEPPEPNDPDNPLPPAP